MHIILPVLFVKLTRTLLVTETRKIGLKTWPGHGIFPYRDQGWNAIAFVTSCHQQPFSLGTGASWWPLVSARWGNLCDQVFFSSFAAYVSFQSQIKTSLPVPRSLMWNMNLRHDLISQKSRNLVLIVRVTTRGSNEHW